MLIYFTNRSWPSVVKASCQIVDKKCVAAAPSVGFLKGQSLKEVMKWALLRSQEMEMRWTVEETK